MATNSPKKVESMSINPQDVEQCKNLQQFFSDPKFSQFLRLFNANRRRLAGEGGFLREVTADDLKNSSPLAVEAYRFFESLRLQMSPNTAASIDRITDQALNLIEERCALLRKLEKTDTEPFANTTSS